MGPRRVKERKYLDGFSPGTVWRGPLFSGVEGVDPRSCTGLSDPTVEQIGG
jgi:hypothetical protein